MLSSKDYKLSLLKDTGIENQTVKQVYIMEKITKKKTILEVL